MRYFATVLIVMMAAAGLKAQSFSDLDTSFVKAKKEMEAMHKEFADFADAALAEYLNYEKKLFEEYQAFRDEMKRTWGDSVVVESSRKQWVEYSEDGLSRTSVDWESGKVSVEVLANPADDEELVRQRLEQAVKGLISSRGSTSGFKSSLLPDKPLSDRPLLEGQLDLSKYGITSVPARTHIYAPAPAAPKPFERREAAAPAPTRTSRLNVSRSVEAGPSKGKTSAAIAEAAEQQRKKIEVKPQSQPQQQVQPQPQLQLQAQGQVQKQQAPQPAAPKPVIDSKELEKIVAKAEAEYKALLENVPALVVATQTPAVEPVKTSEGTKNVVSVSMELVEDHLPKRAEQFKDIVVQNSASYSVDAPLIFAIMEQESAFNPAAQSWVPAYGLMQLVPKSGGRDAYRYVHKEDKIPSPDFLLDPSNNVQLGTGYLKLLMSTTFSKVQDAQCRMLCAIAAYNTGAGNVSRAINGTTNISKAIPAINTMDYDQLFSYLKSNLPHAETKDYIQKVTSKMQKYIK